MNRFLKTAVLSAAVAATALVPLADAQAGGRNRNHEYRNHEYSRTSDRDAIAAGILGLAVGAIAAGVIATADEPQPVEVNPYRHPRPSLDRDVVFNSAFEDFEPEPEIIVYEETNFGETSFEPWTRDWYHYCEDRYRSFNAERGTFVGYDGVERFCVAQ